MTEACRDPVFAAPLPVTYFQQPVQMARQPTPTVASSDWCSSLVLANVAGTTKATNFNFPHDTLGVIDGRITYTSDDPQQPQSGTYDAVINTVGTGGIDLSATCLTRMGMSVGCDVVAAALTTFAASKLGDPGVPCNDSPNQPASCQFFFSYQDISCAAIGENACRCSYGVSFAGTFSGRWTRAGTLLTHSDASRMLPSQADYCVQGSDSMMLSGHDRTSILNQPGIRTLNLQRSP